MDKDEGSVIIPIAMESVEEGRAKTVTWMQQESLLA